MNLSEFDFNLPENLIAQYPCEKREQSRLLMIDRQKNTMQHKRFFEIGDFLQKNDLLVMNNSRTMSARLFAYKKSGGKVEILIEKILTKFKVKALIKCSRKPNEGDQLLLTMCEVTVSKRCDQWFYLTFSQPVLETMQRLGHMPLPPYIKRSVESIDKTRYQTVYAEKLGSIATPTAGLHFSQELLENLHQQVDIGFLTLHVGSGTFQPIRTEKIVDHKMHREYVSIDRKLCAQIKRCKQKNGRVIAVGTTSVRALEAMWQKHGEVKEFWGFCDVFLYPSAKFNVVQGMITNFHLPKSTLYILVCAFAGIDLVRKTYHEAIDRSYRFFSYGDAMLLL